MVYFQKVAGEILCFYLIIHNNKVHPGGDDLPFVSSSSLIVESNSTAKVTDSDMNTQIGSIGNALKSATKDDIKLKT